MRPAALFGLPCGILAMFGLGLRAPANPPSGPQQLITAANKPGDPAHGRLNQSRENFEDGLAIPSSLALKKGGKDKIAFLTFDDGPSPVSKRVLATLAKNSIKATFFIIGQMAEHYPEELKAEYAAGHAIGNHSYTHNYRKIYKTTQTMIDEITKTEGILENILGPTFRTHLFRFPGGYMGVRSVFKGHKEKYAEALKDCGIHFIDWNVDCGDTMPHPQTSTQLFNRVMAESKGQNRIVVLMHDAGAKERTADALPRIIAALKKRGYVFRTLS
ncbi:MAG TPA: polysaccharide deacetylase family protein [Fimbriimonadaceae bacterium]|nr:polysaccharide deacetylase family protein [Fimbriimonadaceae bacterium]